jgi:cbb3-type cytochrome oxidase maturation protein
MSILYVLIPLALLLLGGAVWAFFWAVGSGQFDDLDTPAMRIVMDDDERPAIDQTRADPDKDD